jgi:kynurenine 3-monooxygenase
MSETGQVTIIGAGLAGTLLACMLAQRGFSVDLFERFGDLRAGSAAAGRSVNMALGERGRHALSAVGLLDTVDGFSIPMRGRLLHSIYGQVRLQPYGKDESEVIYSVDKVRLIMCLLNTAGASGKINLFFGHHLTDIDWDTRQASFTDQQGAVVRQHGFEVLIGADGAKSALRRAMEQVMDVGATEELLETGYKELSIPPADGGGFRIDPNALHVWPRGGHMIIALPNPDGSFTVTLFLPHKGTERMLWGFEELDSWIRQRSFMEANYSDAVPLIPDLKTEFAENPVGLMGTVRCRNWHLDGRALLIGDAAHAMVPFHGQGVNAAFEDCVELMACIDEFGPDWAEVFSALQARRRDNVDAIAEMALENHQIMRDSVRQPEFILRKELEHELERRHPAHFVARYSLVMFHRVPYAEAYRRGEIQAQMLDDLLEGVAKLEEVDFERADHLISQRLEPLS